MKHLVIGAVLRGFLLWSKKANFMVFYFFSICHTTRAPRKKEENLEDYCFVTQEEFEQGVVMVRNNVCGYLSQLSFN